MNYIEVEMQQKINPFKQLTEIVYDILFKEIITLQLLPGDKLYEKDISRLLRVSHSTVNYAIKKLNDKGMVCCQNRKPAVVARINVKEYRQIQQVRCDLETRATELAARAMSKQEIECLCQIVDSGNNMNSVTFWVDYDRSFHSYIVQHSGDKYIKLAYNAILPHIDRCRHLPASAILDNVPLFQYEHRKIYVHASLGEPEMAAIAMKNHLMQAVFASDNMLELLSENTINRLRKERNISK